MLRNTRILKDSRMLKKKNIEFLFPVSQGDAIDSEHLSEMTEDDETHVIKPHMTGFTKLDARYLIPFFTKRFTQQVAPACLCLQLYILCLSPAVYLMFVFSYVSCMSPAVYLVPVSSCVSCVCLQLCILCYVSIYP